ncbi:MAG: hypothetical protein KBC21_03605 [Candidatus Pacebacteria bacterium]|nr:hypothetical protein [Candidatus Paceibacterota bacterium]
MEHIAPITSEPVSKNLLGTLAAALVLSAASGCTKVGESNIDNVSVGEVKTGTVWLENMPRVIFSEEDKEAIKQKKGEILEKLLASFPTLDIQIDITTYSVNDYAANPDGTTEYEIATTAVYLEGKEMGSIGGDPLAALDTITEERIRFEVDSRLKIKGVAPLKEEVEGTSVSISPYAGIAMKNLEMAYKDATITLNNGKVVPLKSFIDNTKSVEVYGSPFQDFIITCLGDAGIKKEVKFISRNGEVEVPRVDIVSQLDVYCK